MRSRSVLSTATATLTLLVVLASAAFAYTFPSTNAANAATAGSADELPWVEQTDVGAGWVELTFHKAYVGLSFFEYRIDGVVLDGNEHPIVIGDVIYPGVCVANSGACPSGITRQFQASSTVEIRLALGGERDWDFDWTPFRVDPKQPTTKDDCKSGGWQEFRFANQGQCVRYVESGKDSR